jgi:hypothetical protein
LLIVWATLYYLNNRYWLIINNKGILIDKLMINWKQISKIDEIDSKPHSKIGIQLKNESSFMEQLNISQTKKIHSNKSKSGCPIIIDSKANKMEVQILMTTLQHYLKNECQASS